MYATWLAILLALVSQVSSLQNHDKVNQRFKRDVPENFTRGEDCKRTCVTGEIKECYWKFVMEDYHTMSRACFDCPNTLSDCYRPQCIVADGTSRPFLAINRQHPGPAIEVCEGDRIIIDVYNSQLSDIGTIHWHGQLMKNNQFMDGVPFVTQCPILGYGPFRYDFPADSVGTDFWHTHSGTHRGDGIYGAFVVHPVEDPQAHEYDDDDNILILQDWFHTTFYNYYLGMMLAGTGWAKFDAMLINGKGRNTKAAIDNVTPHPFKLEVVNVAKGRKTRIRVIDSGVSSCPKIISVDNHRMTMIATDAKNIKPIIVDYFILSPGERFDFVIEADQPIGNYWIRVTGDLTGRSYKCIQGVILRYDGAPEADPSTPLVYNLTTPGVVLNPFGVVEGPNVKSMLDLDNLEDYSIEDEKVDKQIYLVFGFNKVNNTDYLDAEYYPSNQMNKRWEFHTPQMNDITFEFPPSPVMSQPNEPQPTVCIHGEDNSHHCHGDFCKCTQVFNVDLNDMVELVLINTAFANHPFHLHGYSYSVVGMGRFGPMGVTSEKRVRDLDKAGNITRKLVNPVLKDTVTIPSWGYTIVRFRADNPGYWLMHCHLLTHSETGMIAILHVGEPSDLPPIPEGFPECKAFKPELYS